jgi:hypothetical protein
LPFHFPLRALRLLLPSKGATLIVGREIAGCQAKNRAVPDESTPGRLRTYEPRVKCPLGKVVRPANAGTCAEPLPEHSPVAPVRCETALP